MAKLPSKRKRMAVRASDTREMELLGMAEDGRMYLWDVGQVRPIDAFETTDGGRWIKDGHYVIEWKGHAVTVHCGNYADGRISVLFMCNRGRAISMSRADVEKMLLGYVVPDPVQEAKILAAIQKATEALTRSQQSPDRARGRIPGV